MSHQDLKVLVLNGNRPKPPVTPSRQLENGTRKVDYTNKMNSASLERKIDEGKIVFKNLSIADATKIKTARSISQFKTQKDMANVANLVISDISDMESSKMILNHANILKIRKVQKILKIDHLDLK